MSAPSGSELRLADGQLEPTIEVAQRFIENALDGEDRAAMVRGRGPIALVSRQRHDRASRQGHR
jgi:hypothetical protein